MSDREHKEESDFSERAKRETREEALRYAVSDLAQLEKSRWVRFMREASAMAELTSIVMAKRDGATPLEHCDAVALVQLMLAADRVAIGQLTRENALGSPVAFPKERFLELAAQCADFCEEKMPRVMSDFAQREQEKREKFHG